MPIEKVVVNASPLILLCKSGLENLLTQLFSEIVVPEAVWAEVLAGADITAQKIQNLSWLRREAVEIAEEVLLWNLGAGESSVLSFALANSEFRAMIDDKAARSCAKTLGINTLGTGGALVLAKQRGLILSVADELQKLQNAGLWLSVEVIEMLKEKAGETN